MASREKSRTTRCRPGPAEGPALLRVRQQPAQAAARAGDVPGGRQPARPGRGHQLRHAPHRGGRHRQARGHGLQDHVGQRLGAGTQGQQAGLLEQGPQVRLGRDEAAGARRQDLPGQLLQTSQQRPLPHQPQLRLGKVRRHHGKGPDQGVVVLVRHQPGHAEHHARGKARPPGPAENNPYPPRWG